MPGWSTRCGRSASATVLRGPGLIMGGRSISEVKAPFASIGPVGYPRTSMAFSFSLRRVLAAAADLTECRSPTGNIATLAQKIVIFTAASYLWDDAGSQRPLLFRGRRRSWRVRRRRPDAGPSEVEAEPPHPAVGGAAGRAPVKPVVPPLLGDGDRPRVLRPLPRHAGRGGSRRTSDRPGPLRAARRRADELPHSFAQFPVWRTDCQVHGREPGGGGATGKYQSPGRCDRRRVRCGDPRALSTARAHRPRDAPARREHSVPRR